MGLILIIFASFLTGLANLFFRKSIDRGGSGSFYLVIQLTFSLLLMLCMASFRERSFSSFNGASVIFGLIAGICLAVMLFSLGKALEKGPPGITLAIINSATVMPGMLMALFFGAQFGHPFTFLHGVSSLSVVCGFFWAAKTSSMGSRKLSWAFFALSAFIVNVLFLTFLKWFALLIDNQGHHPIPFHLRPQESPWFMPALYISASLLNWVFYLSKKKAGGSKTEFAYGILGGVANGLSAYLLVRATQLATPFENPLLFPTYAVSLIVICNAWSQLLYGEKVNWKANLLGIAGLIIGSIPFNLES